MERILGTRYLSVYNDTIYRSIMRIFYLEHRKTHYQMDRDAVLSLLQRQAGFADYPPEQTEHILDLVQHSELEIPRPQPEQSPNRGAELRPRNLGVQQVRRFAFFTIRESERVDLSTYGEPPFAYPLQPRTRTYTPWLDQPGFPDKSAEKAARRQKIPEEERMCPERGGALHQCGRSAVRRKLAYAPAKYTGVEQIQTVYSCRHCERENGHVPSLSQSGIREKPRAEKYVRCGVDLRRESEELVNERLSGRAAGVVQQPGGTGCAPLHNDESNTRDRPL